MRRGLAPSVLVAALLLAPISTAQTLGPPSLASSVKEVTRSLVSSLPERLPTGALAILPPAVTPEDSLKVPREVRELWSAALAEACLGARRGIELTDREHLADVLKEQRFALTDLVDPEKAVEIGKIVSARMILATRLHEFRVEGRHVRPVVDARLIDVQTAQVLWTRVTNRPVLPLWAKVAIGLVALLAVIITIRFLLWRWRRHLGRRGLPDALSDTRVDVDGLVRSVTAARDKFNQSGLSDQAQAIQQAWVELEPVLDRVRHALPGGRLDKERLTDLLGAAHQVKRIADALEDVRKGADKVNGSKADAGDALAQRIAKTSIVVRTALDEYRHYLR